LEIDPKAKEDKDHELDVQLRVLESTSKSLQNVTKNQRSEYIAMRKAGEEFEDAIQAFQVCLDCFSISNCRMNHYSTNILCTVSTTIG
jgi:hypothetical protein